ncbi:MAG: pyridoxamine 5'-phosphate oxidase family protein [Pseudoruegeria sp.]
MSSAIEVSDLPVFHDGEVAMHRKLGVEDRQDALGRRMIRTYMPDQHRYFFASLQMVHLGAIDSTGHPWAVVRTGTSGFIKTPDPYRFVLTSTPLLGEPSDLQFGVGKKVSVVGLEFATRRRNRLNATVEHSNGKQLTFKVDQSYGNCPKYIQVKDIQKSSLPQEYDIRASSKLNNETIDIIRKADTFFIASRAAHLGQDPRAGVDINHRGGAPGFVSIKQDGSLFFPDYKGNNFYNTFGNIGQDDRVGLQFVDFTTGTTVNIKGRAKIKEVHAERRPLMGRGVSVQVDAVIHAKGAVPFRSKQTDVSPLNP